MTGIFWKLKTPGPCYISLHSCSFACVPWVCHFPFLIISVWPLLSWSPVLRSILFARPLQTFETSLLLLLLLLMPYSDVFALFSIKTFLGSDDVPLRMCFWWCAWCCVSDDVPELYDYMGVCWNASLSASYTVPLIMWLWFSPFDIDATLF